MFWLILTGFVSFVAGIFIAGLMTNGKVADLENEILWLLLNEHRPVCRAGTGRRQPIIFLPGGNNNGRRKK